MGIDLLEQNQKIEFVLFGTWNQKLKYILCLNAHSTCISESLVAESN